MTGHLMHLLMEDLKDTLNNSTGVGISAIQIGVPKRVCIIKHNGKETVIKNYSTSNIFACVRRSVCKTMTVLFQNRYALNAHAFCHCFASSAHAS